MRVRSEASRCGVDRAGPRARQTDKGPPHPQVRTSCGRVGSVTPQDDQTAADPQLPGCFRREPRHIVRISAVLGVDGPGREHATLLDRALPVRGRVAPVRRPPAQLQPGVQPNSTRKPPPRSARPPARAGSQSCPPRSLRRPIPLRPARPRKNLSIPCDQSSPVTCQPAAANRSPICPVPRPISNIRLPRAAPHP